MKRQFVRADDPILRKVAAKVNETKITSHALLQIIEEMLDVAYDHRKDRTKPTVVGLAAPQIGISKQIICVDIGADGKDQLSDMRVYINPKILWASNDKEDWCEGCWSTDKVCGIVSRPVSIEMSAFIPEGQFITERYSGYTARILQHEVDHLNGKEFVSHISEPDKLHWVEDEQWEEYKKRGGWRDWPYKCTFDKWHVIKGDSQA
jgi:peptide deformylase